MMPKIYKSGRSQARIEQGYEDYALKSWDKQTRADIQDQYKRSLSDFAIIDASRRKKSNARKLGRASIELENALKKELKRRGK